jgi:hypothetical protein
MSEPLSKEREAEIRRRVGVGSHISRSPDWCRIGYELLAEIDRLRQDNAELRRLVEEGQ